MASLRGPASASESESAPEPKAKPTPVTTSDSTSKSTSEPPTSTMNPLDVQRFENLKRFSSLLGFFERSPNSYASDSTSSASMMDSAMTMDFLLTNANSNANANATGTATLNSAIPSFPLAKKSASESKSASGKASASTSTSTSSLSAQELIELKKSNTNGTNTNTNSTCTPLTQQSLATELGKYLKRDDADPVGGAIVKIPALELDDPEDGSVDAGVGAGVGTGASNLMPTVGQHFNDMSAVSTASGSTTSGSTTSAIPTILAPLAEAEAVASPVAATEAVAVVPVLPPPVPKPKMAASLLHMMTANLNPANVTVTPSASQSASPSPSALLEQHLSTISNSNIPVPGTGTNSVSNIPGTGTGTGTGTLQDPNPNPDTNANANATTKQQPTKQTVGSMISNSTSSTTHLEMKAAINMTRPQSFTRSSAHHAPTVLIRSLFSSFSALIASRMKTWTLLLLRHSLSSGDRASRDRLMGLLRKQNKFEMRAMVTEFQVEDQDGLMLEDVMVKGGHSDRNRKLNRVGMESCDLILPIKFKAVIDATIQDHHCTVHLDAPGSIGAIFSENEPLMSFVEAKIDANTLISSMVKQARLLVFQAVSRATTPSIEDAGAKPTYSNGISSLSIFDSKPNGKKRDRPLVSASSTALGSSGPLASCEDDGGTRAIPPFSGPVSSSIATNASTSLLRRPGSFAGTKRANKSVQWNSNTLDHKPHTSTSRKRLRKPTLSGPTLTRSSKSFGKPGADIFESSRNATFGEFGNIDQSPHLSTRRSLTTDSNYHYSTHILQRKRPSNGASPMSGSSNINAQFSALSRSSSSLSSSRQKPSFQDLSRSAVYSVTPPMGSCLRSFQKLSNASSMSRTPTQLESLLLSSQTRSSSSSLPPDSNGNKNAKF